MLKPTLKLLPDRLPMLKTPAKQSGRDADSRRTLKLNGAAWQALRKSVLVREPLCRECTRIGLTVLATDVDHRDGNPGNNAAVNLNPLCQSHHSQKTARDHGKHVSHGCDVNGWPLDPAHPWAVGTVARLGEKSPATDGPRPPGSLRAQRRS